MDTAFIKAFFDLDCEWEGMAPRFRIYLGDELFTERLFDYTDSYLTMCLQISAPPGQYLMRVEPAASRLARFTAKNYRVTQGPARWLIRRNESLECVLEVNRAG